MLVLTIAARSSAITHVITTVFLFGNRWRSVYLYVIDVSINLGYVLQSCSCVRYYHHIWSVIITHFLRLQRNLGVLAPMEKHESINKQHKNCQ